MELGEQQVGVGVGGVLLQAKLHAALARLHVVAKKLDTAVSERLRCKKGLSVETQEGGGVNMKRGMEGGLYRARDEGGLHT
jgi:hypothetical protein